MPVIRLIAVRVVYHYIFSVSGGDLTPEGYPAFGRIYRRPYGGQYIYAAVRTAVAPLSSKLTAALFLNCRVLYSNRVGFEDGVNFWGGSEYVAPSGESIIRAALLEEDLVTVRVAEGALRRERIISPLMRDENLFVTLQELQRIAEKRRG